MKIIVGLGNPGDEYKITRHNTGFMVVDELLRNLKFKTFKKKDAEISEGSYKDERVILVKPLTFMNSSGVAVKKIVKYSNEAMKQLSNDLLVVHDDIDLPLGTLRIVRNRGSAGHKGVESVIRELAAKDFVRFRIGIGKTINDKKEFVLGNFSGEDKKLFQETVVRTAKAILFSLENGIEKAMNKYNSKED